MRELPLGLQQCSTVVCKGANVSKVLSREWECDSPSFNALDQAFPLPWLDEENCDDEEEHVERGDGK